MRTHETIRVRPRQGEPSYIWSRKGKPFEDISLVNVNMDKGIEVVNVNGFRLEGGLPGRRCGRVSPSRERINNTMDMTRIVFALCAALSSSIMANANLLDVSADRVRTPLRVDMERVGTIMPRSVSEIRSSNWTLGCETIERGYADFWQYADYIAPLGIKTIRIQAGWARCEPKPGTFDFAWLDRIVDFAIGEGVNVLLETSYGNPAYPGAGGWDLGAGFPTSKEGLAAWDRWVETLAFHFKGRVRDWAMWNEPDIRNPALPGHDASKTPEEIAQFNVRTAKIIRRAIPDSRLAGLSLASLKPDFFENCLKAMGEDVKLFDWFIYHGYTAAPEEAYSSVEQLKAVLAKYHPAAKLRQGENGCPSELSTRFALSGIAWSEYSQAKWNMRRMLGDLGHDVESSLFTICDFTHKGRDTLVIVDIFVSNQLSIFL